MYRIRGPSRLMGAVLALVAVIMLLSSCSAVASQASYYNKTDLLQYAAADGTDIAVAIVNHLDMVNLVSKTDLGPDASMPAWAAATTAKKTGNMSALCAAASVGDAIWDGYIMTMNKESSSGHYGGKEDVQLGNRFGRLWAA